MLLGHLVLFYVRLSRVPRITPQFNPPSFQPEYPNAGIAPSAPLENDYSWDMSRHMSHVDNMSRSVA